MDDIKFLDLFGGIGGFRLGLERASDKFKCINYYDNDKYAVKSYNEIFEEDDEHEPKNIREIETNEIKEHELLCAGFPCQSFSLAGTRKGFEDERGTLFYEIARIARDKRPQKLFLENVKGLLSAKAIDSEGEPIPRTKGYVFHRILETLDDLGYFVEWMCLNSKDFGVPQNRERVFIIGHLGGEPRRKVFPLQGEDGEDSTEDEREGGMNSYALQSSPHYIKEERRVKPVLTPGRLDKRQNGRRMKDFDDEMFTLTGKDIHGVFEEIGEVCRVASRYPGKQAGGVYDKKGIAPMVNYCKRGPMPHHVKGKKRIRKLTPRECWRLQGFPDWAFDRAREVNSDTQLYKQAGNAVTVNVIEAIGKELLKCFKERGSSND